MRILAASAIGLFLVLPAAAQDRPPAPPAQATSKDALEQCKAMALAQGLDTNQRRVAVATCVLKARPEIASRVLCLMHARLKNLDKEARMAAIKDCATGKK